MNLTTPGFSVTTNVTLPVSVAPDGCPIVHGAFQVTAHDADWAVLNHRGSAEVLAPLAPGTISLSPGDVLILGREYNSAGGRASYMASPGRSAHSRMAAIACAGYASPGVDLLRPMGIGGGVLISILRGYPIPASQINLALLPSIVTVPDTGIVEEMEAIFGGFCGEVKSEWATDQLTPDLQHPGYGTWLASYVSQALLVLCSTLSTSRKANLARLMVQWGIDLAGAFADGRVNGPNGGHMQGRKALIILAGHLLGITQMANPNSITTLFQENRGYFTAAPAWWNGWLHGWNCYSVTDGAFLATAPSNWTTIDPPNGRCDVYRMSNYYYPRMGSNIGTALAMRLLGRETEMGAAFIGSIEQWMAGPSTADNQAMLNVGVPQLPWGTDYCVNSHAGMCAAAWVAHA